MNGDEGVKMMNENDDMIVLLLFVLLLKMRDLMCQLHDVDQCKQILKKCDLSGSLMT
jgi:hypothetical protein